MQSSRASTGCSNNAAVSNASSFVLNTAIGDGVLALIGHYGWIGNLEYAGSRRDEYYVRFGGGALVEFGKEELKVVGQR